MKICLDVESAVTCWAKAGLAVVDWDVVAAAVGNDGDERVLGWKLGVLPITLANGGTSPSRAGGSDMDFAGSAAEVVHDVGDGQESDEEDNNEGGDEHVHESFFDVAAFLFVLGVSELKAKEDCDWDDDCTDTDEDPANDIQKKGTKVGSPFIEFGICE